MNKKEEDEIIEKILKFNEEWENDPNTAEKLRQDRLKYGTLTYEQLHRRFTI